MERWVEKIVKKREEPKVILRFRHNYEQKTEVLGEDLISWDNNSSVTCDFKVLMRQLGRQGQVRRWK